MCVYLVRYKVYYRRWQRRSSSVCQESCVGSKGWVVSVKVAEPSLAQTWWTCWAPGGEVACLPFPGLPGALCHCSVLRVAAPSTSTVRSAGDVGWGEGLGKEACVSHKPLAVGWVASRVLGSFLLLTKKAAHGLTGVRVHFFTKIHKDFFFFEPRYSI